MKYKDREEISMAVRENKIKLSWNAKEGKKRMNLLVCNWRGSRIICDFENEVKEGN